MTTTGKNSGDHDECVEKSKKAGTFNGFWSPDEKTYTTMKCRCGMVWLIPQTHWHVGGHCHNVTKCTP